MGTSNCEIRAGVYNISYLRTRARPRSLRILLAHRLVASSGIGEELITAEHGPAGATMSREAIFIAGGKFLKREFFQYFLAILPFNSCITATKKIYKCKNLTSNSPPFLRLPCFSSFFLSLLKRLLKKPIFVSELDFEDFWSACHQDNYYNKK